MKKKIICALVATSMLFGMTSLTGCDALKKATAPKWIEEAQGEVAKKMNTKTCTTFYLNGETYEFPCKLSEFTDNGWEFVDKDDAEDEVESWTQSEYVYNFTNKDNQEISIGVTNTTDDTLVVTECTADIITITEKSGNVMLAGGIQVGHQFKSIEELEDKIDLDDMAFDDDYESVFESEDGNKTTLKLKVYKFTSDNIRVDGMEISCEFWDPYDLQADVEDTVKAVMLNDPSYMNQDFLAMPVDEYVEIYRGADGLPAYLEYYMYFEFEEISDLQMQKFDELFKKIYEVNTFTCTSLMENKVMIHIDYYDFDDVYGLAYDALEESGIDTTNYETSEECFVFIIDKMIEIYSSPEEYNLIKMPKIYNGENVEDSTLWDDVIFLTLGMPSVVQG